MRNEPGKDQETGKPDGGKDVPEVARAPIDPVAMARRDLKKTLPRRFWTDVSVAERDEGFGIDLDGRPVRTPGKALLAVPVRALADEMAAEWRAQAEWVEPDTMPMTRLVNTAIDAVAKAMDATIAETAKFAETDLVCYRAGGPETLVAAQATAWDPVLAFARHDLGARFICAEGVIYVAQPQSARDAVCAAVATIAAAPSGALGLAALSLMTNLMGSVLLALAVARHAMTAEDAWAAAHVDEDYQMRTWGTDAEALTRRAQRWRDMRVAARAAVVGC